MLKQNMELLEYWKEIALGLVTLFGTFATISEKFRDTVTFWKTRKSEAIKDFIDINDKELSFTQKVQKHHEETLDRILEKLKEEEQKFEAELLKASKVVESSKALLEKSEENNQKSKILIGRYRAHIRYLEGLLSSNKIEFYKIEDNGSN